jgi:hypothetical protein
VSQLRYRVPQILLRFLKCLNLYRFIETGTNCVEARAVAQAVSRRLPTAAARVRSCGSCGGQSGTGAGFLRVLRFPLTILILPTAPQSSSIIWGWYNRPNSGYSTKWTKSHPMRGGNLHGAESLRSRQLLSYPWMSKYFMELITVFTIGRRWSLFWAILIQSVSPHTIALRSLKLEGTANFNNCTVLRFLVQINDTFWSTHMLIKCISWTA